MSIDANVVGLTFLPDGSVRMTLEQPDRSRTAGRDSLIVREPPGNLPVLLGLHVWGGCDFLMCGEVRIGQRDGYGRCWIFEAALEEVERTGAGKVEG